MQDLRRLLKSESGQILQAGIAALVTIGATLVAVNVNKEQKKAQLRNQVVVKTTEIQARIKNAIKSDVGWAATVANNASLNCLKNAVGGTCVGQSGNLTAVYDETGTATLIDNAVQGYTYDGQKCNGFVAAPATGSDQCPYGISVDWQPLERGTNLPDRNTQDEFPDLAAFNCTADPCDVRIVVRFQINSQNESLGVSLNEANYYVDFSRQESAKQEELVLMHKSSGNAGQCGASAGTWVNRIINTSVTDTGDNVVDFTGDQTSVTFRPGTYSCEVTAPAAIPFSHQAALNVGGTRYTGTSAYYYTPSYVKASFTIAANTAVSVQHICEQVFTQPSDPARATELGRDIGAAQDNVYTVLKCVKKAE